MNGFDVDYLWMNWVGETPDKNQRWRHDNPRGVVDAIVERKSLADRHRDDALCCRMPINTRYCALLTKLKISE